MHLSIEPYTQGVWVARVYSQTLGSPRVVASIARCTPPEGGVTYVCATYFGASRVLDECGVPASRVARKTFAACREHIERTMESLLGLPPEHFDPLDPKRLIVSDAA